MAALGSLVVKLALDYSEYTQGLSRSDQAALNFAQNTQRTFDGAAESTKEFFIGMATGAATAVGALLGVGATISRFNTSIDTLGKLDDAAQKTGSSIESLSRIQETAEAFGHSFDVIDASISKLARGMTGAEGETGKASKALAALGISSHDAAGKLRDPSQVLIEVSKRLQGYRDDATKSQLVTDLFGKSGADLLPILNDIAENIDRFGGVSGQAAKDAALLQDQFTNIRASTGRIFTSLVIELLPTFQKVGVALGDVTDDTSLFSGAVKTAKSMIDQLVITGAAAGFLFTTLGKTVSTAASQLMALGKLDFRGMRESGVSWFKEVMKDYEDYQKFATSILEGNKAIAASVEETKPALKYSGGDKTSTANAASDYEKATKAADSYIAKLREETENIGLNAIQVKLLSASREAAIAPLEAQRMAIMEEAQTWALATQAHEDAQAAARALQETEKKRIADLDAAVAADEKSLESLRQKNDLMEHGAIETQRLAQVELQAALDRAWAADNIDIKVIDTLERRLELSKKLGDEMRRGEILTASKDAAKETADAWKQASRDINRSLTDALLRGFESGKGFLKNLRDTAVNMFQTMILRPTISAVLAPMTGGMAGLMPGTATAGGAGGMGSMDILSMGSSLMSAMGGGLTGGLSAMVSGLGSMFGSSAISAFGAGLGMSTSAAAGAAGAYSAAGMASTGSAIGMGAGLGAMAGPLAIAAIADMGLRMLAGERTVSDNALWKTWSAIPIVGILPNLVNALFGAGPKKLGPAELTGEFTEGHFSGEFQADWKRKVGLFGGQKRGRRGLGISTEQASALAGLAIEMQDVYEDFLDFTGDAGRSLSGWTFAVRRQIETEEQQQQLTLDLSSSIGAYLVPELTQIQQKGEALTATLGRARAEFELTTRMIDMTGQSFGAAGLSSLKLRDNLVQLLGGMENAGAALQPYFDNFYSDAERAASGWRMINSEMTRMGITSLPTTREQFRALVESQDLATDSGQRMFAALIALSPAFAELTEEAKRAKEELTLLGTDAFVTLVDYTRYIRLAANAGVGPATPETYTPDPSALAQGNVSANNAALLEELRQIRAEQQAGDIAIAQNTAVIARVLSRWEGDGMPDVRDVA